LGVFWQENADAQKDKNSPCRSAGYYFAHFVDVYRLAVAAEAVSSAFESKSNKIGGGAAIFSFLGTLSFSIGLPCTQS